MKMRGKNGAIKVPWTAGFEYVDREGVSRVGKGRTFIIDGSSVDLFPIGTLCGVLGRNHRTIYKWEKDFGFPRAMYRVSDAEQDKLRIRCNRWYSRRQLTYIQACYEHVGCLRKKNRTRLRAFIIAVRKAFYTIDIPIKERSSGQKEKE